jgi:hypothetical protein
MSGSFGFQGGGGSSGTPPTVNYGLFAQTQTSNAATGIFEKSIIGTGVGTLTVPKNSFKVGDSFTCSLDGEISCIGSATLHIHVKTTAGVILADTGIIAMAVTTGKAWTLDVHFTIRKIGTPLVAIISSGGLFSYIKDAGLNFEGFVLSTINNTTFNTSVDNTLEVTAQWNSASLINKIASTNFVLNKTY